MPAHKVIPDTQTLRHWIEDEGLTHQQCADRVYALTGHMVSRSTISAALHRAGISKNQPRYTDELPWKMKVQHIKEYPARMLRLLGRRRAGLPLSDSENTKLDNWLAKLEKDHTVVGYDPDSTFGFYYIEKDDSIDGKDGIPIRRQTITVVE